MKSLIEDNIESCLSHPIVKEACKASPLEGTPRKLPGCQSFCGHVLTKKEHCAKTGFAEALMIELNKKSCIRVIGGTTGYPFTGKVRMSDEVGDEDDNRI